MVKKILGFYTKYFVIWIILFGIAAYLWPEPFLKMGGFNLARYLNLDILLKNQPAFQAAVLRIFSADKLFFSLTMFGIGAVLQIEDFKRIAQKPAIVVIGSCAQFLIMPFGAFFVAKIFDLDAALAAGLILTGSAPGAMASNVMCYISKADTAYSVSLTTVSTLLCPILTPGLTLLLAGSRMPINFWAMVLDIMWMVIIPLFIGFTIRHYLKKKIEKILPLFPAVSVTFIIFICSLVIALNKDSLRDITAFVLLAVLVLNIYGMSAGYGVAALFKIEQRRRRTLSIEIGMQNAGLGVTLALEHLGNEAAIPAAIFVFTCIITASVMSAVWQRAAYE